LSIGSSAGQGIAQEFIAGSLTLATGLGTNATMFVHGGVLLTNSGAGVAGDATGVSLMIKQGEIGLGLANQCLTCGTTYIGTIEIGADAFGQVMLHFLCQASVGTSCAGCGADNTGTDAVSQLIELQLSRVWMGV